MVHGAWCMVHGAWCMVHGAFGRFEVPQVRTETMQLFTLHILQGFD